MSHGQPSAARQEDDAGVAAVKSQPVAGGHESFDELIQANLTFVAKIASEYRGLGLPFEDLLNEGSVGLIEAAYRFDATRGNKFATYAVWWVRKAILGALARQPRMVRLPDYQHRELRRVRDAERSLGCELGRRPDSSEISERLSRSVVHIERVMQSGLRELWIDAPVGGGEGRRLSDSLSDRVLPSPEELAIRAQAFGLVGRALSLLSPREREVIRYRYGLGDAPGLSLSKVGKRLGLSGERVRQIEADALARLRQMLRIGRIDASPPKRLRPPQRI